MFCKERTIASNELVILGNQSKSPKIVTIKKICNGLGITLGELFSTKEFDNLEQEIK